MNNYQQQRTVDSVYNSRQTIIDDKHKMPFEMFHERGSLSYKNDSIKATHDSSLLNQAFFSQSNIDQIQNMIRHDIYKMSNGMYTIGKQSNTELIIIMRSIYFQYARHLLDNTTIRDQVEELNIKVVRDSVPKILSQIQQYYGYMRDSTTMHDPMELPKPGRVFGRKVNTPQPPF